jgi:hypothetical protein
VEDQLPGTQLYDVAVTTLDQYVSGLRRLFMPPRIALIKIDIEGFEAHAIRGGLQTISRSRPALCIDIHASWEREGDTEPDVRALLAPMNYSFERSAHVLLCSPG